MMQPFSIERIPTVTRMAKLSSKAISRIKEVEGINEKNRTYSKFDAKKEKKTPVLVFWMFFKAGPSKQIKACQFL